MTLNHQLQRAIAHLLSDYEHGVLDSDVSAALYDDALRYNDARLIVAGVFDGTIRSADGHTDYTPLVRERVVMALLHPRYRREVGRVIRDLAPQCCWSRSWTSHLTRYLIYCWEHRDDPPEPPPPSRGRSLWDQLYGNDNENNDNKEEDDE